MVADVTCSGFLAFLSNLLPPPAGNMWLGRSQASSSTTTARLTVRSGCNVFETTVTSDSKAAGEWARNVRACHPRGRPLVVGIDCKWKPTAGPWPLINQASILQLCVGTSCLVHQLFSSRFMPSSIESLLNDPDVRFVSIGEGAAKLAHAVGLACVDLAGVFYDFLGTFFRRTGIKGFARQKLYINMEKPSRIAMSDWGSRNLDADQIKYACIDAYVASKLGEVVFDDMKSNLCQICRHRRCFLHKRQVCGIMGHLQLQ